MSADEWNATPWHDQRAYLEYLEMAEDVPFEFKETGGGLEELPAGMRPATRTVDAGSDVIDLTAMRDELEAHRRKLRGG